MALSAETPAQTKAEKEALQGQEMFRHLADIAPMMMWMTGKDKLCTYVNRSWLELTGRPIDAELGYGWSENVHPEDLRRCMQTYVEAFDRREEFKMEYRLRRHDGVYRWIWASGTPMYSPDGVFEGYIGSCGDISDNKELESERNKVHDQIAQLNRVGSMGQLAASLAHELAQPLAAMLSNAQAAARYASMPSPDMNEIRAALEEIIEDNHRARAFLDTMRAMFKKRELSRASLELNRCVNEISRIINVDAVRKGVEAEINLAPRDVLVMGDCIAVQQIVLNLVNNGMDALHRNPDGHRRLIVSVKAQSQRNVGSISVEDNGIGIAEEHRAKLFTPFFTTKAEGLGLGLSICRSLVETIGGQVYLVDRPRPGALFQVDLPMVEARIPIEHEGYQGAQD